MRGQNDDDLGKLLNLQLHNNSKAPNKHLMVIIENNKKVLNTN